MMHPTRARTAKLTLVAGICLLFASVTLISSQVPENKNDPNGVKIPYPRVRLTHSMDTGLEGTTAFLRAFDPYLFYQLGRDLVQRQFVLADGVNGRSGSLSVPLYVETDVKGFKHGSDARFARDHTNSCGMCHSVPFREPGAGQTISSTGGMGRNTPHFYGAGLMEMLGEQTRRKILSLYDRNRNGVIDRAEVQKPAPVRIAPAPGVQPVDYGDLSPGTDGIPRLNSVFRVWYLDARQRLVATANGLNDPRVAAFGFAMQPFGWGRGYRVLDDGHKVSEGGEASTLRAIYTLASDVHLGLQAFDPTQQGKASGDSEGSVPEGGEAGVSLNGALQYDFGAAPDRGRARTTKGVSLDDPDQDEQLAELTEGDVDAAEFYMLHAPAPATRASATSEQGRVVLHQLRCTSCHVENWKIEASDKEKGYLGDRRFFHLATRSLFDADRRPQIVGSLVQTYRRLSTGEYVARGGAFLVDRLYSDFKQWDVGPNFYERRYDGTVQREHRTAPLWGLASTAPYGHAGQYQTLDEVISAHGGAAQKQRDAYLALSPRRRRLLLDYLQSLVLYPTDEINADINGDGLVSERYYVAGQYVGYEKFDARFLFAIAPRYKHLYNVKDYRGREIPLALIDNVAETYRLNLLYRRDADGDGFPDVLGALPFKRGARR